MLNQTQDATRNSQEIDYGDGFFANEDLDTIFHDSSIQYENYRFPAAQEGHWKKLTFTVLSMIVSSSFFSGYSVKAFYTGFVILIAP